MQRQPVSNEYHNNQHENQQQQENYHYDFSQCTRIKKLTTHDIYKFKHQNIPLVLKLFSPDSQLNYQQELRFLSRMNSQQILRIIYNRSSTNPNSCQPLEKSHLIVVRQAVKGDLNDYLPRFGRMTQKMARTYFKKIIETLSYASSLKPAIYHPNLQASSILLDQKGRLYICGWSQLNNKDENQKLEQIIFSCGQILICMVTSFMPFYKKYSNTDAFFKFISPKHIHKFWQQLQKRMTRIDKKFIFSADFKKFVQSIFLKKSRKFDQIQEQSWINGDVYTSEQLLQLLQENQKIKLEKITALRKQQFSNQQNRKKVLMEYQLSYGLQRSSPDQQQFINDYQQYMIKEEQLPQGKCNLKIQNSPGFVVACIRSFLREQNGKLSVLVRQQFILRSHKVFKINNYLIINLNFAVSLFQQDEDQGLNQPDPADIVSLKLKISFYQNNKQIYAQVEVVQSNFNSFYTTLAVHYIQNKINCKRGNENIEKKQII